MGEHSLAKSGGLTFLRRVPSHFAQTIEDIRLSRGDRVTTFSEAPAALENAIVAYWANLRRNALASKHHALLHDVATLANLYADLEGAELLRVTFYASSITHQPLSAHTGIRLVYESSASDKWAIVPANPESVVSPYSIYVDITALRMGEVRVEDEQKLTEALEIAFDDYNLQLNVRSVFEDKDISPEDRKALEDQKNKQDKPREESKIDADKDPEPEKPVAADEDSYVTDPSERALPKEDRPHGETLTSHWMRSFMGAAAGEFKLALIWLWQKMPASLTRTVLYLLSHAAVNPDFLRQYIDQVNPEARLTAPVDSQPQSSTLKIPTAVKSVSSAAAHPVQPESSVNLAPPLRTGGVGPGLYRALGQASGSAAQQDQVHQMTKALLRNMEVKGMETPNPHPPDRNNAFHTVFGPHAPKPGSSGDS